MQKQLTQMEENQTMMQRRERVCMRGKDDVGDGNGNPDEMGEMMSDPGDDDESLAICISV